MQWMNMFGWIPNLLKSAFFVVVIPLRLDVVRT